MRFLSYSVNTDQLRNDCPVQLSKFEWFSQSMINISVGRVYYVKLCTNCLNVNYIIVGIYCLHEIFM